MLRVKLAIVGVIAMGAITGAGVPTASAQTPQAPYYGNYGSPQGPVAPGPVANACQPGPAPGCQVQRCGCYVQVCPCPCQAGDKCEELKKAIPAIHHPPTCAEVNPCVIDDEQPPQTPTQWISIYRNCYVPIKIQKVYPSPTVTPVNIQVNWREVHVLCDSAGVPIAPAKAAEILKEMTESMAKGETPKPGTVGTLVPAPTPAVNSTSNAPAAGDPATPARTPVVQVSSSAPSAPATNLAQTNSPTKQWVWLAQEGVYGYGYQRGDGLWEIDAGTRRATLQQ
jgi:hypothetical protein